MKKLFLATLLVAAFIIPNLSSVYACTNILVSRGASSDGSAMIAYSADAGGFMERLYFYRGGKHNPGETVDIYEWDTGKFLGKIKQAAETYNVVGNMNDYQVSVGETTFGGRSELIDTNALVDYGSLMQLALQRAKTAREAIKVMTSLVAEYGYYSSGESFSVADPNEVWIMEMISKGPKERGAVWVARRVPDGYIAAHANMARIREFPLNDPDNCLYAPDVISFAEKAGYYDKKKDGAFSFVNAYCPPDPGGLLFCESRVWSIFRRAAASQNFSDDYFRAVKGADPYPLFVKPDAKLSVRDMIGLMRDHFEGTPFDMTKGVAAGEYGNPYRWKPLEFKIGDDTANVYGWERPISTQQTAYSFVSQMRSDLPREIGGIMWYGVDDTYGTVYMPFYCSMSKAPRSYVVGAINDFTMESAWWIFNLVNNLSYHKYSYVIKDIQAVQKEYEDKFFAYQPALENAAKELYKQDPKLAASFLSDYSVAQAEGVAQRWRELWRDLVMKYNDGYINDVNREAGRHPKSSGYGDELFKRAVSERPGYYDVRWREKNEGKK